MYPDEQHPVNSDGSVPPPISTEPTHTAVSKPQDGQAADADTPAPQAAPQQSEAPHQERSRHIVLWVVIAILGFFGLAGVLYVAMTTILLSDARSDARQAAFRSVVAGEVGMLIIGCEMGDLSPPTDTALVDWDDTFVEQDCGSGGEGTFRIEAQGAGGVECRAIVSEQGATFSDSSGGTCVTS